MDFYFWARLAHAKIIGKDQKKKEGYEAIEKNPKSFKNP
jgi:hypothetical protein